MLPADKAVHEVTASRGAHPHDLKQANGGRRGGEGRRGTEGGREGGD